MIPDFIPINMTGMSIFSAIFFIIIGVGFKWLYDRSIIQDNKIETINKNLNNMNVDIAETKVIVQSIKESMGDLAGANQRIIQTLLNYRD